MASNMKQFKLDLNEQISKEIMAIRIPHTKATSDTAMLIAERLGNINRYDLHTACVLHDIAKELPYETMVKIIINARGNPILDEVIGDIDIGEYESTKWLHGIVGAIVAYDIYGVTSKDVLKAIRYHKVGNLNDPIFTKILITADVANPLRRARHMVAAFTSLRMHRYDIEELYKDIVKYDAGTAIIAEDVAIPRMIQGLKLKVNKLTKCHCVQYLGKYYSPDAECVSVPVPDYDQEGNAWKRVTVDGVYVTPDGFQSAMTVLDNIEHDKTHYTMVTVSEKDWNAYMYSEIEYDGNRSTNSHEVISINDALATNISIPRGFYPKNPTRWYTIDTGNLAVV